MTTGFFNLKPIVFVLTLILTVSPLFALLTPAVALADYDCLTLSQSSTADQRAYCQGQITSLEAQIAALNTQLATQKKQSGTLQGDINILTTQITAKKKEIQAKILKITQLNESIGEKQTAIVSLSQKIQNEKQSLAQLLRKTDEMDHSTLTNFLLSSNSLSDFYSDVSRYNTLKSEVKSSVDTITTIKGVTEQKKADLLKQQNQTIDEKANLESVQKSIQQDQQSQKQLLTVSKGKESLYQQVIADQQAKVAKIKAKLFQLAGGGQAIRFDVALQYANQAARQTGIDPAYLLAELTQESNLGANVGKCYISDTTSGAGINVNSGKTYPNVMKASRDIPPFLALATSLGFDPMKQVVSCPIAGVAGYGGAMGPAQFIPSTWALFIPRLQTDLGHTPNPWAAGDAFMAASLYLTDLGGVGSSASGQLRASCKYYGSGGSTCSYGRNVQALKNSIQSDIDYLNQYGISRR